MATCKVEDPSIIPKLLKVMDLVLKAENSGSNAFHDAYTFDRSVFFFKKPHTLGRRSVSLVNECLLNHRLEEAAKLLWVMCQDRSCFDLVLYKGIMVVLENLMPNGVNEIVKELLSNAKDLHYTNKWDVQLEYLIYILKNNTHDLENSFESLDKTQGKGNHRVIPYLRQINSAYCSLLNYRKWVNISQGESSSLNDKDLAFNIINSFKKLLDHPGIWDIFVLKLIEMLEYYEEFDELEQILEKYVECNPNHVNAYIYLCIYLHKHKAGSKKFIEYAKVLCNLSPSDERVLLLVQVWNELGKKLKKRLKILFYFLDYPVNGRNILAWQILSSHLCQAVSSKKSSTMNAIKSLWSIRCNVWNYFIPSNINSEDENFKLIFYKVKILTVLEPNHEYIQKAELKFPHISKHESTYDEVIGSNSTDFRSLYQLGGGISRVC